MLFGGVVGGEFSTSPLPLKVRDLRLALPEQHRHLRPLLEEERPQLARETARQCYDRSL
jgi:hypothetical protein